MKPEERLQAMLAGNSSDVETHLDAERLCALAESDEAADPEGFAHLGRCGRCREEWITLRTALGGDELPAVEPHWKLERSVAFGHRPPGPERRPRFFRRWQLAVALGLLALFVVMIPTMFPPADDPLRSDGDQRSLGPIEPSATVAASGPLAFSWYPDPDATEYELIISRERDGDIVLRKRAREASVTIERPEADTLVPGETYLWLVRAEIGVGDVRVGPPGRFVVAD